MGLNEIRVGDWGTAHKIVVKDEKDAIVPLDLATSVVIRYHKPTEVSVDKAATLTTDGTDGAIFYIFEDGLIDVKGVWSFQVIVTFSNSVWSSEVKTFTVYKKLPDPPA